ncbi:unnamed protein product [Somion occarium]|uniref:Uncharacterized protein n=1 Tax=Somion occarium TaxID=3059160 RepID=A0ABP1CHH1_9APHY
MGGDQGWTDSVREEAKHLLPESSCTAHPWPNISLLGSLLADVRPLKFHSFFLHAFIVHNRFLIYSSGFLSILVQQRKVLAVHVHGVSHSIHNLQLIHLRSWDSRVSDSFLDNTRLLVSIIGGCKSRQRHHCLAGIFTSQRVNCKSPPTRIHYAMNPGNAAFTTRFRRQTLSITSG